MRLLRLDLIAYGPFTRGLLDFKTPERGVHVIYGPNEAGKSTTLRAVTALLYGFPHQTTDGHLHANADLRVGGALGDVHGRALEMVRRKGRKETLLDPSGKPLDEAILRRLLGGVSEEQFLTTFGLNHLRLQQGAQELLQGKGLLGESLFAASLGGAGLHDLRERLREEAEALFTPQAKTKPLSAALKTLTEAQKKVGVETLQEEAWRRQESAAEEARADIQRLEAEHRDLQAEMHRAQRAQMVLPQLEKRRNLILRRAALGPVVMLPESARRQREEAERIAAEAALQIEALARDIAGLQERHAALRVPESLVEQTETIAGLQNRLGSHVKAVRDLPKVEEEERAIDEDARAILRRLGRNIPLTEAERLRVDIAAQARIKPLARQSASLEAKLQQLVQAQADYGPRHAALEARRGWLPPARDASALRGALERAQREGDLEQRLAKATREAARLAGAAKTRLAAMRLCPVGPDAIASLPTVPVPALESMERWDREWIGIEERGRRLEERGIELRRELLARARAIDEIQHEGAVPTEDQLGAARGRRDEAWRALRASLEGKDRSIDRAREIAIEMEQRQDDADAIADRLRREAARVAKLAGLLADRAALEADEVHLRADREALAQQREAMIAGWTALWAPTGIAPLTPAEMRGWLSAHGELLKLAAELAAVTAERDALAALMASHRAAIEAALRRVGEPPAEGEGLARLIDIGARCHDAIEESARERRTIESSLASLAEEGARITSERAAHERALAGWREAWTQAVVPIGLPASATPEEATAVIDELEKLFSKLDEAKRTRRRTLGIRRDAEAFAAEVARLVQEHAPDLAGADAADAAKELVRRHYQGRTDLAERGQIDKQLAEKRDRLEIERERRERAREDARALMRAAGASSPAELEHAERLSEEARDLDRKLHEIEAHLLEAGKGASIEALTREHAQFDESTLDAKLTELQERLDEVEDRRRASERRLVQVQMPLDDWKKGRSDAADAAVDAQACLAKVRDLVDRYVRLKLAGGILGREIERYRQQNQGPILTRAGELFRRLTLGAYLTLRSGYGEDDEPVLLCVREGDREVTVEGLSDGTRDQLYLALRLATLERHTEERDPMPLLVDDILIHFDDERARAALEVLGELGDKTQVLFFTHHARLLDLAREAVPAARLGEHRLVWEPARRHSAHAD